MFRAPRLWSNQELKRLGLQFTGRILNASGWRDEDKAGGFYRDYFPNASAYDVSNWSTEIRGYQGVDGEILLDLEDPPPDEFRRRYDVVFNHTTLEHVFDLFTAFRTLCELSRDIVIVVVPFAQQHHPADFGDYWRFTPQALDRLFAVNDLEMVYVNGMNQRDTASYILGVGARDPERWRDALPRSDMQAPLGSVIARNTLLHRVRGTVRQLLRKPHR